MVKTIKWEKSVYELKLCVRDCIETVRASLGVTHADPLSRTTGVSRHADPLSRASESNRL